MKRYLLLSLLFLIFQQILYSQDYQKPLITYDRFGDGLFDFYAENKNNFPVQMRLTFTQLENMEVKAELPFMATLFPGKQKLFHLRRIIVELPGNFDYKTEFLTGAYPVVHDSTTCYILPFPKGQRSTVKIMDQTQQGLSSKQAILFKLASGDTVSAARGGIVAQLIKPREINGKLIGTPSVVILHPDNTFGRYEQLSGEGFLVETGQTIEAGTPIGLAPSTNEPYIQFSVYHLNAPINRIMDERIRDYQHYILPLFCISQKETSRLSSAHEYLREY